MPVGACSPTSPWRILCSRTQSSDPIASQPIGVPAKQVAQLMGHAKADTTLNVYTQTLDESLRSAVETVGGESFSIVQSPAGASELTH